MVGRKRMYRDFTTIDIPWAEEMLGRINSSARILFHTAFSNGNLVKALVYECKENKGIVSVIKGDDYYSVQISFQEDLHSYEVIKSVEQEVQQIILTRGSYEVYLNVNGYNVILLNSLANLGFMQDALGFEFILYKQEDTLKRYESIQLDKEITMKTFEDRHSEKYLRLLDNAFRKQNIECGQEQDTYLNKYSTYQIKKMKASADDNCFYAFWIKDDLIGLCFFENNYLDTITVDPIFEGKGYGSKMMEACIYDRWFVKNDTDIYLHTYIQNRRAQRLYLKHGFEVQGFYAENTYLET